MIILLHHYLSGRSKRLEDMLNLGTSQWTAERLLVPSPLKHAVRAIHLIALCVGCRGLIEGRVRVAARKAINNSKGFRYLGRLDKGRETTALTHKPEFSSYAPRDQKPPNSAPCPVRLRNGSNSQPAFFF
jgi:hypothetical protein